MRRVIVCSALILAVAAFTPGLTQGQITWPDPNQCDATVGVQDASCMILPDGSGTTLADCYGPGGVRVDATITVVLRDAAGLPVWDFPAEYIRINHINGYPDLLWCDPAYIPSNFLGANCADYNTTTDGVTTFAEVQFGGGYLTSGTQIWVMTSPTNWAAIPAVLPIRFNSPDLDRTVISGSHAVDLLDVSAFVSFYWGPYDYRADFNWDGDINLRDVIILSDSLGKSCP